MSEIVRTDDVMDGQPRIEGRRISVVQIAEWILDQGMSPEEVSAEFDLDLADIFRALAFYYDNVDEMQEVKRERQQRVEEGVATQPSPEKASDSL